MNVIRDEILKKYTTVKIGGQIENFYIPNGKQELLEALKLIGSDKFYVLSGGSNILATDEHSIKHVIYMKDAFKEILSLIHI